jgi:hypothetical protein
MIEGGGGGIADVNGNPVAGFALSLSLSLSLSRFAKTLRSSRAIATATTTRRMRPFVFPFFRAPQGAKPGSQQ